MSYTTVSQLLTESVTRTGLRDAAGQPLTYTAHDFRRMFATDAVTAGMPVHIAARLLGHRTVTTTQSYLAVFQQDLVHAYRTFVDNRRAYRPDTEYREPTADEWREFQQHFHARKLELGDCGRPYGAGCQHEHACLRCPMLRVSPAQRDRLLEIITNLRERIDEAKMNGWLGEAQGLQHSLTKAKEKLLTLDRWRTPRQYRSQTSVSPCCAPHNTGHQHDTREGETTCTPITFAMSRYARHAAAGTSCHCDPVRRYPR
ncbi:tyrosine-type recombinase/integrase [Nocardia sp. NPDC049190]|uniref:tyrosine-type recombinase/integrase n=1 Tax=Nocardia sp. NPDC049190 TaxID=3155650 RepID=UPI0033CA65B8